MLTWQLQRGPRTHMFTNGRRLRTSMTPALSPNVVNGYPRPRTIVPGTPRVPIILSDSSHSSILTLIYTYSTSSSVIHPSEDGHPQRLPVMPPQAPHCASSWQRRGRRCMHAWQACMHHRARFTLWASARPRITASNGTCRPNCPGGTGPPQINANCINPW